jgi:WhiB family redox-sensing transcriptional regulator
MAQTTLSPDAARSANRWRRRAACRKLPTEVFYPTGNYTRGAEERAKTVCSTCPVRADCLVFAIDHDEPFGVWGGLTAEERRTVAAQERRGS